MKSEISIRDLGKRYPRFTLHDVTIEVPRGHIVGLIGPNGAGKTTIIKSIMGLVRPDRGAVSVFGMPVASDGSRIRSDVGFVPDEPKLFDDVTLKDHVRAFSRFYAGWDEECFVKLAGRFEIPLERRFKHLSQGMKSIFCLVFALSHRPRLLVLDEPTSGLDPVVRRTMLGLFSEFARDTGGTVLFSTHITADLERVADYITFVFDGAIEFSASAEEVKERYLRVRGGAAPEGPGGTSFVGMRKSSVGFEALVARDDHAPLDPSWVAEPATLEEIMYFTKKEHEHVCASDSK